MRNQKHWNKQQIEDLFSGQGKILHWTKLVKKSAVTNRENMHKDRVNKANINAVTQVILFLEFYQ